MGLSAQFQADQTAGHRAAREPCSGPMGGTVLPISQMVRKVPVRAEQRTFPGAPAAATASPPLAPPTPPAPFHLLQTWAGGSHRPTEGPWDST